MTASTSPSALIRIRKTGIAGEDSQGRHLRRGDAARTSATTRCRTFTGKQVVVIGGGNVAMDVTRSAIRLGADKVTCVYRRRQADMTALPDEVDRALSPRAPSC